MSHVHVDFEQINNRKVAFLYLDNPETRNSMTWAMGQNFHREIEKLKHMEDKPACLILTGKNGVFSSGGDLALLRSFKERTYEDKFPLFTEPKNSTCQSAKSRKKNLQRQKNMFQRLRMKPKLWPLKLSVVLLQLI